MPQHPVRLREYAGSLGATGIGRCIRRLGTDGGAVWFLARNSTTPFVESIHANRHTRCGALHRPIWKSLSTPTMAIVLALFGTASASAHAIAGQRLFPSTLNLDDPGIGAELPLVFSHIRVDGVEQNDLDMSVTKPITPGFSLTAGTDYFGATGGGLPAVHGWNNVTVGAVWQVYRKASTESIASFSINRSFAHTGSRSVRDDFST